MDFKLTLIKHIKKEACKKHLKKKIKIIKAFLNTCLKQAANEEVVKENLKQLAKELGFPIDYKNEEFYKADIGEEDPYAELDFINDLGVVLNPLKKIPHEQLDMYKEFSVLTHMDATQIWVLALKSMNYRSIVGLKGGLTEFNPKFDLLNTILEYAKKYDSKAHAESAIEEIKQWAKEDFSETKYKKDYDDPDSLQPITLAKFLFGSDENYLRIQEAIIPLMVELQR